MTFSRNNNSIESSDQLMVTEQSGFSTSLVGIFIAVILGFVVRGALAPEKIKARFLEASQRLGEGIHVTIDQAYFSLSRGVLPDFSVVVKNVHFEASNKCWFSPDGEINEIRFPISIHDLLAGRPFFHSVEIDNMVLLLRNEMSECGSERGGGSHEGSHDVGSPSLSPAQGSAQIPTQIPAQPQATNPSSGPGVPGAVKKNLSGPPDVQFISVNRLRVNYLPLPFTSFELLDLDLSVKSDSPKAYTLESALKLGGETLSGDYSSLAKIHLRFDESRHPQIESDISGSWREGQYDLSVRHDTQSLELSLLGELRHIPLSQVFPVLKKYKVMVSDFNGRQTWLSSQFSAKGKIRSGQQIPLSLKNLKVEGDLGEVSLAEAEIRQWSPVQFDPVIFNLKDVDLKSLLFFLNRPHPSPALGHLGVFNGTAQLLANQSVKVKGSQKGFEMIFSNKGDREVQVFSEIAGDLDYDSGRWTGDISKIEIQDGEFKGKASLSSDKDWKDLRLSVDVQNLTLSPKVQRLMTHGGVAEKLQLKIQTHLIKGELKKLEGSLRGDVVRAEGVFFKKPQFLFSNNGDEFQIDFNSDEVRLESPKTIADVVVQFRPEWKNISSPVLLKRASSRMRTRVLQDFQWNSFDLVGDQFRLQSSGGWNEKNELFGHLSISDKGKNQKWKILGTRDKPIFSKE